MTGPDADATGRVGPRGRGRRMITPLRAATVAAFALAATALAMGDDGDAVATALAIGLVAAPLGRVAFLAVRWAQLDDRRFSLRAGLLLGEIGLLTVVAFVA